MGIGCGHCTLKQKAIQSFCCHDKALDDDEYDTLLKEAEPQGEKYIPTMFVLSISNFGQMHFLRVFTRKSEDQFALPNGIYTHLNMPKNQPAKSYCFCTWGRVISNKTISTT